MEDRTLPFLKNRSNGDIPRPSDSATIGAPGCTPSRPHSSQVHTPGSFLGQREPERHQTKQPAVLQRKDCKHSEPQRQGSEHLLCPLWVFQGPHGEAIITISDNDLFTVHSIKKEQPFFDVRPYTLNT